VGGSGTGGKANVTYDTSGNITAISMHTAGSGYKAGDVLSIAAVTPAVAGTVVVPTVAETTAGVTNVSPEVQTVTFNAAAMAAGDSITIAGLTFTANQAVITANAVAAFAGLTAGATTGGSALGVYSGTLTGFNTGVGSATALTFTSTTNANVATIAPTVRQGGTMAMAEITNIVVGRDLSSLSGTNKTLTMSGTINGLATTQSLAVSNNAALATQTFNFTSFGAQFDVKSYQAQSASHATKRDNKDSQAVRIYRLNSAICLSTSLNSLLVY
jgi:hypothetical protein